MQVRLHRFLRKTSVEGPGRRACVWVQGCSIRCPGCFNPGTWRPDAGEVVDVADVRDEVLATPDIEGITFLGGEPFDQAPALAALGAAIRAEGLSVMTFSGYEYDTLASQSRQDWQDLLGVTDLLVDGPFISSLPDDRRPWVGSTNQQFRFLTGRYQHLAAKLGALPDRLELRLCPDGVVLVNGMASDDFLGDLEDAVGRRQLLSRASAGS